MADTLYDFYTGQGQNLPSIADRSKIFESSGLGNATDYQGTAEQNTSLLNNLQTPITETDAQAPDIDVPEQENPYDIASWGQGQTQKSANEVFESAKKDLQDRKKEQETLRLEEADQSGLIDKLKETMDQTINKGTDTFEAIKDSGYYDLEKKDLAVQNSIDALGASLNLGITDLEGKPMTMRLLRGKQAQLQNQALAKQSALAVQSLAIQGRMDQAKSMAEDMINAKYAPFEQEIANQQEILKLNMDNLSRTDKIRADKLIELNKDRQTQITDEKNKEQSIQSIMAQAAGNKADNSTLEKIRNSVTIEDAIIAAGTFLSPDTDINGNWATYEDADGNTVLYDKNTGTTKPVTHNADGSIQYDTFTDANGVNWNMGGWAADETKSTQMQAVSDRIGKLTDENIDAKVAEFAPGLTSDMIREASAQSGVSWEALLAMVSQEATIGGEMSNVANKNNNFGGLKWSENTQWKEAPYNGTIGTARPGKEGGNYTKFPSKQEGLNAMASLMSQYGTVADTPDDKQILIDSVISNVNKGILTLDQALKQNPKLKNEIQLGVAKNIEQLNNAVLQDLDNKMQLTENLFDHPGLDAAVGTSIYTRAGKFDLRPGTVWDKHITGNYQDFLATMEQLVSEKALSSLIEAKEKGATFGALSEGEMAILKAAATKLGPLEIRDKNGKLTGYNASEKTVKAELKKVQAAYESLYYGTVLENNFKQFPDKIDEYNSLVATYPGISNKELNELIDFN